MSQAPEKNLLAELNYDSWPDKLYVLRVIGTEEYAAQRLSNKAGLTCFADQSDAIECTKLYMVWRDNVVQEITFDDAYDIAKAKAELSCLILNTPGDRVSKVFDL